MKLILRDADSGKRILEHFNLFHDGFIKRFLLTSHDRFMATKFSKFSQDPIQRDIARGFSVRIDFAHYNYKVAGSNSRRIIRAKFLKADKVVFDLTLPEGSSNNRSIDSVEVVPAAMRRPGGKDMDLIISWNVLLPGKGWQIVRNRILSFEQAQFQEV